MVVGCRFGGSSNVFHRDEKDSHVAPSHAQPGRRHRHRLAALCGALDRSSSAPPQEGSRSPLRSNCSTNKLKLMGGFPMPKIAPFLWFDDKAEEAVNFYVSIFKNSKITAVARYGEAGPGP